MQEGNKDAEIGEFQRTEAKKTPPSAGGLAVQQFMKGVETPEATASEGETPAPTDPTATPEQVEAALTSELAKLNASPQASYEERLESVNCSLEEAREIVDAVMEKGFYEKRYPLTTRHSVVLRTRGVSDQERLQQALEANVPQFVVTINEMTSKYNLAACLAELQAGKTVKFATNQFDNALSFVNKLSLPLFNALVNRLAEFDRMVFTVLSPGVVENF